MKAYIFIIILGFWSINFQAQINHTSTFKLSELNITNQLQGDGNIYADVSYENCFVCDTVGMPSLPYRILRFIVPNGPLSFSIKINSFENKDIDILTPVLPIQKATRTSIVEVKNEFVSFANTSSEIYPKEVVQIVNDEYLDGDKHILTIKVAPVQYVVSSKKILFHSLIDFTIDYQTKSIRSGKDNDILPITPYRKEDTNKLFKMLDFVENKSDISKFINQQSRSVMAALKLPTYEYVVITSDDFAPYFKRLIDWKRQKGLNAGIVTMQQILKDPTIIKDEVSNLADDAGKLRQYLRLSYQNGTKYVLLGGRSNIVPIRYGSGYSNSDADQIPTDLYFSELNGNWNKDGDKYYGEPSGDLVSYEPELFVGRLLCRDGMEVDNYLDKLLVYEQNPGKGDFAYLKKAFYTQSDQMQKNGEGNSVANDFKSIFSTYSLIEELPNPKDSFPTFPTGKDVIDIMKNSNYGFWSWFGHGCPQGINAKSGGENEFGRYNFIATEGEYVNPLIKKEQGNGLNNLVNIDHPAIAYTIACDVSPYDVYVYDSKNYHIVYDMKYNLAETLTVAGKYGCVSFLGNTRAGWVNYSTQLERIFIDKIKNYSFKVGVAEAKSKADYKGNYNHWLALSHNLIGCPEFEMWTDIPSKFLNASVTKSLNSLMINSGVLNTNIALRGLFSDNRVISQTGQTTTFTNLPKNYVVTLYRHNYIPYVTPIFLQNESVTGKYYIAGNQVFMGSSVDASKTNGDFVIKSGADIVLEISDGVTLDAGTIIEAGGVFEVKIK